MVGARVRQEGFPQEDFYGVGPHSNMGDRTSYMREGLDMTGYVTFAPRPWLNIETSAGFLDMQVRAGKDEGVSLDRTALRRGHGAGAGR